MTTNVGFIGLGQMGAPMAMRLNDLDVQLHIYDVNPEACKPFMHKGAVIHDSALAVASQASIVFASLPNPSVSEETAFGDRGVCGGAAIRYYVEMSTVGQACMQGIASRLEEYNIVTIDAPVSGGPPAVREGRLAVLAAGDPIAMEAVYPYLEHIGNKVHIFGHTPGQAQVMKLINNLIMAANSVIACEGLAMGAKAGLNTQAMGEMLSAGTAQSTVLQHILIPHALSRDVTFGAHLSILLKDVKLGLYTADDLGFCIPAITTSCLAWKDASNHGYSHSDVTSILEFIEMRTGIKVGGSDQ